MMKSLLLGVVFCSLCSVLYAEHITYLVPIDIEKEVYASDFYMSVKERKISTNSQAKYKMSKGAPGFDKATTASEAFASSVIDAVFDKDENLYQQLTKKRSPTDKSKNNSKLGYSMLQWAMDYSDHVYFVNEYELLGLNLYEARIVPLSTAEDFINEQNNSLFLAIAETGSGVEHRFNALFEPVVQNLINARQYTKNKDKKAVKEDLKSFTKVSYKPKFDDSVSTPANIDYYFKVIQPAGNPLIFENGNLAKADFSNESNELWSFYAGMWSALTAVPEVDEFQSSAEYNSFIDNLSESSAAQLDKSLTGANGRQFGGYKRWKLGYREVLFAIDAYPVYFVFYTRSKRPNPYGFAHDTILHSDQGYKRVNLGYLSDLERLFDSTEFNQALVKVYEKK